MSARLNRQGATLPLTILVIVLLGVSVAMAHLRLTSERHNTGDIQAQLDAFNVAESGLSRYMSTVAAMPVAIPADVTYNDLPGGTAVVSVRRLRDSTTNVLPAVYVVTSRGINTTAKRYSAAAVPAERTVASIALWTPTPFDLNASFTSLTGFKQNGAGHGFMSGYDNCTAANGGGMAAIPGVATPDSAAGPNGAAYGGSTTPIQGNPEDIPVPIGTPGPTGTAKDAVDIDWAAIVAGSTLPPDYTAWPASFTTPVDWPTVKINGDFSIPNSGKGILIVTGNLTWLGTPLREWDGLILVGGTLTSNGQANVRGAVITGLNVKIGVAVGTQDVGNGTKNFMYDSCALKRALGKKGSLQRVRNGWTDTWPSY
jgi:hypothetical protein